MNGKEYILCAAWKRKEPASGSDGTDIYLVETGYRHGDIYDKHGNVWELVWQCYKEYGTNKLDERELGLRGGDFNSKPISCRSATRCCNCNSLTHKIGLRLALTKKWSASGEIFDSTLLWKVHDGKLPQNAF